MLSLSDSKESQHLDLVQPMHVSVGNQDNIIPEIENADNTDTKKLAAIATLTRPIPSSSRSRVKTRSESLAIPSDKENLDPVREDNVVNAGNAGSNPTYHHQLLMEHVRRIRGNRMAEAEPNDNDQPLQGSPKNR